MQAGEGVGWYRGGKGRQKVVSNCSLLLSVASLDYKLNYCVVFVRDQGFFKLIVLCSIVLLCVSVYVQYTFCEEFVNFTYYTLFLYYYCVFNTVFI